MSEINKPKVSLPTEVIESFCQKWKVRELSLFGSVLRDDFTPGSDIDILIAFSSDENWDLFDFIEMEEELSSALNRKIDLVTKRSIEKSSNPYRKKEILGTAQVIYDEAG